MIINIPVAIPDDSVFRIRCEDGTLYGQWTRMDGTLGGRGTVFQSMSAARACISYRRLKGAKIEVLKPEVVLSHSYNPYGKAS